MKLVTPLNIELKYLVPSNRQNDISKEEWEDSNQGPIIHVLHIKVANKYKWYSHQNMAEDK